jgi:Cys-tRNA(Pro)/Cys-tRNA(Cys) deacylase
MCLAHQLFVARPGLPIPAGADIIACLPEATRRARMVHMQPVSLAEAHVLRLGIAYTLRRHSHPIRSLAEAASEWGMVEEQIVRSLVFRLQDSSCILLLMPGPSQVAWGKLRHFLGVSRITTASADEVVAVTGYRPGTVSPFGLPKPLPLLADERLRALGEVTVGAGVPDTSLIMQASDLIAALSPAFGDFSGDETNQVEP